MGAWGYKALENQQYTFIKARWCDWIKEDGIEAANGEVCVVKN